MTVRETFKFAFDSMSGGSHLKDMGGGDFNALTEEHKRLFEWMDDKDLKVSSMLCSAAYAWRGFENDGCRLPRSF